MPNFKIIKSEKERKRVARAARSRKKIHGNALKPRLVVSKSNRNLFVQAIDDNSFSTLASMSTLSYGKSVNNCNIDKAVKLGESIGKELLVKGFTSVVFDRAGRQYTGVIKALCDSIRSSGIKV